MRVKNQIYVPNSMRRTGYGNSNDDQTLTSTELHFPIQRICGIFACDSMRVRCAGNVFFFILLRIEMGQRNKNSWFYFVVIHSTFGITRAKVLVFILAYVCSNAHSVHAKRVCSCFSWTFYRIYFPVIHLRYERTSPRQSTIINLTRLALSASH